MDLLSHFILALLAGLAMGLHRKHRLSLIVFISFCSILIDLDHFLVPLGYASQYRSFHNVFVVFFLPLTLFLLSYLLERKTQSNRFQTFFLLLTVMLTGHVIFDLTGPVQIFYPLSDMKVSIPKVNVQVTDDLPWAIVQPAGVGLALYALIVFLGALLHDTLYHKKHKHLSSRDALHYALRDFF